LQFFIGVAWISVSFMDKRLMEVLFPYLVINEVLSTIRNES